MSNDGNKRKIENIATDVVSISFWTACAVGAMAAILTPDSVICPMPLPQPPPTWSLAMAACGSASVLGAGVFKIGRFFRWW